MERVLVVNGRSARDGTGATRGNQQGPGLNYNYGHKISADLHHVLEGRIEKQLAICLI